MTTVSLRLCSSSADRTVRLWDLNLWDSASSALAARYDFAPAAILALPAPGGGGGKSGAVRAGSSETAPLVGSALQHSVRGMWR